MKILKWLFNWNSTKNELYESNWVVSIDEDRIKSADYNGDITTIEKSQIFEIQIETNDEGPWFTDVFWVILHSQGTHKIPQGATGEESLIKWTQSLKGFDNEEFIKAMQSTDNETFILWKHNTPD